MKIVKNLDLKHHSFFRTKSSVETAIFIEENRDFYELHKLISNSKFHILGDGSNTLFRSEFYSIPFIIMTNYTGMSEDHSTISIKSGTRLSALIKFLHEKNIGGTEFLTSIPGLIGGATSMNAGAYGTEMKDIIKDITLFDLEKNEFLTIGKSDANFKYRGQEFLTGKRVIESVTIVKPSKVFDSSISEKIRQERSKKFPKKPNCGSVFKNPENQYAGKIIEDLGLKGLTIGGARVSYEHANVIENFSSATGSNIFELIDLVKSTVRNKTGIELSPEIKII